MLFLAFCILCIICSCDKGFLSIDPISHDAIPMSILPGECLMDNELLLQEAYDGESNNQGVIKMFFKMNLNTLIKHKREFKLNNVICDLDNYFYRTPGKDVYSAFGANAGIIAEEYEKYHSDLNFSNYYCDEITIFYEGGMILTADKEFAGYPAGTNLGDMVFLPQNNSLAAIPGIEDFGNSIHLSPRFGIFFPSDGWWCQENTEVNLSLSMPVKVGLLLQWLNDRIDNPDAEMQYKDEVLTCNFTIDFCPKYYRPKK